LDVDYKDFQKVLREAGESSLVELDIEGDKEKRPCLIHDLQRDAISDKFIHIDFFQTSLTEEVEVKVPLVFEGTSLAVKDLGGTLVKNISELEIKAFPQNLPHEIRVSIDSLNTFLDHILVKDLNVPKNVKVMAEPDEIVLSVAQPENVEEDLATELEEKVEDVEKVEKEKKIEDVVTD
jgi:large subunit ribosomal protein L25